LMLVTLAAFLVAVAALQPQVGIAMGAVAALVLWRAFVIGVRVESDDLVVTNVFGSRRIDRDDVAAVASTVIAFSPRNSELQFHLANGSTIRASGVGGGAFSRRASIDYA